LSKSEIVVPLKKGNTIQGVLDVDSTQLNHFDTTDQLYLEQITALLEPCL
jgi:GAF domain-containing protein